TFRARILLTAFLACTLLACGFFLLPAAFSSRPGPPTAPEYTLTDQGRTGPKSPSVEAVAFAPNGKALAAGDQDGSTYLWNIATGNLTGTLTDPRGQFVDAVAFSPDGKTLAAGDSDGTTYLWNITNGNLTGTFSDPGRDHHVSAVAFSRDGKTLAA